MALISLGHAGDKHLVLMGGGGEPKGPKTLFDPFLKQLGRFQTETSPWQTSIAFNGGHQKTDKILRRDFRALPRPPERFDEASFNRLLDGYEARIRSGEIGRGDQLLVMVHSHGAAPDASRGTTHEVATATGQGVQDFVRLTGSSTVSLDRLKRLQQLAGASGVKLAIYDGSCYSGATQALADANTCVITATGPNNYASAITSLGNLFGLKDFSTSFAGQMRSGRSLEDVFLQAREGSLGFDFPMISSPVGRDTQAELYDPVSDYLRYHKADTDAFFPMLDEKTAQAAANGGLACMYQQTDPAIAQLISLAAQLGSSPEVQANRANLERAMRAYEAYQERLIGIREGDLGLPSGEVELCEDDSRTFCSSYSRKEILSTNYSQRIQEMEQLLRVMGDGDRGLMSLRADIQMERRFLQLQQSLKREFPTQAQALAELQDVGKVSKATFGLAFDVTWAARKLYNSVYRERARTDTRPNPCRDFRL